MREYPVQDPVQDPPLEALPFEDYPQSGVELLEFLLREVVR